MTGDKFFNDQEMATIAILADIIIPKDDVSGSATDAKVPEFIEFIVKDHARTPDAYAWWFALAGYAVPDTL